MSSDMLRQACAAQAAAPRGARLSSYLVFATWPVSTGGWVASINTIFLSATRNEPSLPSPYRSCLPSQFRACPACSVTSVV